jgi:TetR/AcrR family transcriptional repressor of nem operon
VKQESETKRKILETALELIWESSYGSVSVDDICTKAGVNKGSFYYAFKSKSDLAVAAFERHWEIKRPILDQIFSSQLPPLERLGKYCNGMVEDQNEKYRSSGKVLGCPFCSLGSELSTQDENIRKKVEQMNGRFVKYFETIVSDLAGEGLIESKDDNELARELYSYIMGVILQAKIDNNPKGLDRLQPGVLRLLNLKKVSTVAA